MILLYLSLLCIYLKEPVSAFSKNVCIPVFVAVLSSTAKSWNQSRCPSAEE
jgi:hypothetical protein